VATLIACSASAPNDEAIGQTRAAIVAGSASDASQDAVVMLVTIDPAKKNQVFICTAALLAPRLVLTARHCVSDTDLDVACSADGKPVRGGAIQKNHDPKHLYVFTGKDRPILTPSVFSPAGRGLEILDDGATNLCNHDLALVLLEKPIDAVPLAPIRLDSDAAKGERLVTVGWGVTLDTVEPDARQQRAGVTVTRVGPDDNQPVVSANEIAFDESICLGDSGGPVLAESTGAVVGVVSRGGNGSEEPEPKAGCIGATNLATKVAPFKDLLLRGYERAGAQPRPEERKDEEDDGCATASRSRFPRAGLATLLAALGVAVLRRRRITGSA
jgi:secreted trypsin-like serine protease